MTFRSAIVWVATVLALAFFAAEAHAFDFSYSGRLIDSQGKPLDGPVALKVSFYHSATAGSAVLEVTAGLSNVSLQDGIFQIKLALDASDFNSVFPDVSQVVYVEITDLTHAATTPYDRQQISLLPYAGKIPIDTSAFSWGSSGELKLKSSASATVGGTTVINTTGDISTTGKMAVGGSPGTAKLEVTGAGSTSATAAMSVTNSAAAPLVYVRNDGNVGIGTTSPSYVLELNSSVADAGISIKNGSSEAARLFSNSSTDDGRLVLFTQPGNSQSVDLKANGPSWLNGGNVGIGTASPNAQLHLLATTPTLKLQGINEGDSAHLIFSTPFNNGNINATAIVASGIGTYSRSDLQFVLHSPTDNTSYTVGTDTKMIIKNNGLVGIGTTAPSANLDVKGNASTALTGTVSATSGSATITGVSSAFNTELAAGDAIKIESNIYTVSSIASATSLTLTSNASASASGVTAYKDGALFTVQNSVANSKLIIDKSGNVGIGTINPAAALHVNGSIVSSSIYNSSGALNLGAGSSNAVVLRPSTVSATGGSASNPASTAVTFQPASSTGDFTGFGVFPTVNTSGTYSGATSAFRISQYNQSTTGVTKNLLLDIGTNTAANSGGTHTPLVVVDSSGNVGIGTTNLSYTLHVVGTAGLSTGTAWTNASDLRLKNVDGDYDVGLSEIMKLHPVRFTYKKDNALGLPVGKQRTGFIAQEVRDVIPEAVIERDDGYLELNVDPIHWGVVNAVRELKSEKDAEITKLKSENAKLQRDNEQIKTYICGKDPSSVLCN